MENPDFFNSFVNSMTSVPKKYVTRQNILDNDQICGASPTSCFKKPVQIDKEDELLMSNNLKKILHTVTLPDFLEEIRLMDESCVKAAPTAATKYHPS